MRQACLLCLVSCKGDRLARKIHGNLRQVHAHSYIRAQLAYANSHFGSATKLRVLLYLDPNDSFRGSWKCWLDRLHFLESLIGQITVQST